MSQVDSFFADPDWLAELLEAAESREDGASFAGLRLLLSFFDA